MKKIKKWCAAICLILTIAFVPLPVQAESAGRWIRNSTGWWYRYSNGSWPSSCWRLIGGDWYYFDSNGYMESEQWVNDYYVGSFGAMLKNQWVNQYYVGSDGKWIPDRWVLNSTGWWWCYGDGSWPSNQWKYIGNHWYYFDSSGYMVTGWKYIGNSWFYMNFSGAMVTGWQYIDGHWYHFNSDGYMGADQQIGSYYLTPSGAMAQDEWIRRTYYDQNGVADTSVTDDALTNFFEPTYFTKVDDTYFVIDSQSSRVLYSTDYSLPAFSWTVLDDDLYYPHSGSGHDDILIVDDTINGRWKVYRKIDSWWKLSQVISASGDHPHFTYYDAENDCWYSLGSVNDNIYILKDNGSEMIVVKTVSVPEIGGYSRSFSIIDGYMYILSELPGKKILKVDYKNDWKVVQEYPVTDKYAGMNGLMKYGDNWYATVYRDASSNIDPHLIKLNSLDDLTTSENVEDLYSSLGLHGIPYFFSQVDDNWYLATIEDLGIKGKYSENSIAKMNFDENGSLIELQDVYYKDGHSRTEVSTGKTTILDINE